MSDRRAQPLLSAGREADWAAINRADSERSRAESLALSPAERLDQGQRLSREAVSLLVASVEAGHVPATALWS